MKTNCQTVANGKCVSCGQEGLQSFIADKGKRKGEKFINHSAYYKVFEEVSWMRGDDEYIGTFCKKCFKYKKYLESVQS